MQAFQLEPHFIYFRHLAFSPDGRWLAVGAKWFTLIDTTDGTLRVVPEVGSASGGAAFVGGGRLAYTSSGLRALDLATGHTDEKRGYFFALAGAPRAEVFFASVVGHPMSHVARLATADLSARGRFARARETLLYLAISADGRWLAGQSETALRVWNVGGRNLPARPSMSRKMTGINGFAISADGARLAVAGNRGLGLWDTATGKEALRSGKHRRAVTAVACSPAGPILATGDAAGNVFLWDHAGNVLNRYAWGLGKVNGLAFAPDGLRCAAADEKCKVVIWDVEV
jgi:WD40 repeat protein